MSLRLPPGRKVLKNLMSAVIGHVSGEPRINLEC